MRQILFALVFVLTAHSSHLMAQIIPGENSPEFEFAVDFTNPELYNTDGVFYLEGRLNTEPFYVYAYDSGICESPSFSYPTSIPNGGCQAGYTYNRRGARFFYISSAIPLMNDVDLNLQVWSSPAAIEGNYREQMYVDVWAPRGEPVNCTSSLGTFQERPVSPQQEIRVLYAEFPAGTYDLTANIRCNRPIASVQFLANGGNSVFIKSAVVGLVNSNPLPKPSELPPPIRIAEEPTDHPVCEEGSIIRTDTMSVGETVKLVGTPISLTYFSDRVIGYMEDRKLKVPLTGANVLGISQVELEIEIAGQIFQKTFSPAPNLSYDFQWNGLNGMGAVAGAQLATVKVTYRGNGGASSAISSVWLGKPQAIEQGLGGWMASEVHKYDFQSRTLYFGYGGTRKIGTSPYKGMSLVTSEDGREAYLFDANGKHLKTLNTLLGNVVWEFSYDNQGRLLNARDAFANETRFIRAGNNSILITGPFGQTTSLKLDASGWLSELTNPNNESYKMTYWSGGLIHRFERPNGNSSLMSYTNDGLLMKDEGPGGNFTSLERLMSGDLTTITLTTAMGRKSSIGISRFDDGNTTSVTNSVGTRTERLDRPMGISSSTDGLGTTVNIQKVADKRFSWLAPIAANTQTSVPGTNLSFQTETTQEINLLDANDPLSLQKMTMKRKLQNDLSRVYTSEYSAHDRQLKETSPEGRVRSVKFNSQGLVSEYSELQLQPATLIYDSKGQLTQLSQGPRKTSLKYDASGNLESQTNSIGQTTAYRYDKAGRVTTQIRPDGKKTKFEYDAAGNLITLVPPSQPPHRFLLSPFDFISAYLPPSLGGSRPTATHYEYDLDRQLTKILRPDRKSIEFIYEPGTGSLNSISASDARVDYKYHPSTPLVREIRAGDILLDVGYVGNLIKTERMSGEVAGEIGLDYNTDFSIAAITVKSQIDPGVAIQLGYDHDGLLAQAGDLQLKRSLATEAVDKLIHGRTTQTLSRDNFGELSEQSLSIGSRAEFSIKYERDKLGRVVSRTEKRAGKPLKTYTFSYDEIGRLRKVFSGGKLSEFYVYDANGNRLRSDDHHHFRYDNQDRLVQAGVTRYQYNLNGDLEAKMEPHELSKFKYDSFGNLRSVDTLRHRHGNRIDKLAIDYLVDGRNRRVGKKIDGKLVQSFIYQSNLQIAAELDRDGRIVKRFVYGSKLNVPDYMITPSGKFQILSDELGSPRLVIDVVTGRVVQEIEYDSFGKVLRDTKPGFVPFGFAGGIYDQNTKLIRFGARDYDPDVGRWTAKDPILFSGGDTNLYGYVLADPINFFDPTGLIGMPAIGLPDMVGGGTYQSGACEAIYPESAIIVFFPGADKVLNNRYIRISRGKFPEPNSFRISIGKHQGNKFELGISTSGRIAIKFPGSMPINLFDGFK